eukprot:12404308-Alexandrium_andersonii.AAC.1
MQQELSSGAGGNYQDKKQVRSRNPAAEQQKSSSVAVERQWSVACKQQQSMIIARQRAAITGIDEACEQQRMQQESSSITG